MLWSGDKSDLPAAARCHQSPFGPKRTFPQPSFCPVLFRPGFIVRLGPMPREIRDQLFHMAFDWRQRGGCIGHFMVEAWTRFRFRHNAILHYLCDVDLVHPVGDSFEWAPLFSARAQSARPQPCEDGRIAPLADLAQEGILEAEKDGLRRSSTEDQSHQ